MNLKEPINAIVLILCLFLIFSCKKDKFDVLKPDDVEKWNYFNTGNGLPSNKIYCLAEDAAKNIWIGTDKGLAKYDGTRFTIYTRNTGLPSDSIYALYFGKNNELVVGTNNGFGKITSTGKFTTLFKSTSWRFTNFCEDRKDPVIYCATFLGIVVYYYKENQLGYASIDSTLIGGEYYPDEVVDVTVDNKNYTWLAGDKGIYVYKDNSMDFYSNKELAHLGDYYKFYLNDLFTDKSGNVWIGSSLDQKVMYYDGSKFVNDSIFFGLNSYTSFAQDQYNNYWISIDGIGVLNYGGGMSKMYNTQTTKISSNNISILFYDSKNNIWIGSKDKGLMYYQNIKPIQYEFDSGKNSGTTANPIN